MISMTGLVVAKHMPKTVTVLVGSKKRHPLYKKSFVRTKKYLAHDEQGVVLGDVVEIVKVKPISKRKHWQVIKVLAKDLGKIATEALKVEAEKVIAEVMPEKEEIEEQKTEETEKPVRKKGAKSVKS